MMRFQITVRTDSHQTVYTAISQTSFDAYMDALNLFDGMPCCIAVKAA